MEESLQHQTVIDENLRLRIKIQSEALNALIVNNGIGTINMDTGSGKSKVAIDFILNTSDVKSVLITSPRDNLKENWKNELIKWFAGWIYYEEICDMSHTLVFTLKTDNGERTVVIDIINVQTAYKFAEINPIPEYDLIIGDEVHTFMTPAYSNVFKIKSKYRIGLTATTDTRFKDDKLAIYNEYIPIIYRYNTAEKDGVVNKVDIIVIDHHLNNDFKIESGSKAKRFMQGEADAYIYTQAQVSKGELLIALALPLEEFSAIKEDVRFRAFKYVLDSKVKSAVDLLKITEAAKKILGADIPIVPFNNYFGHSSSWYWNKNGNEIQKEAGRVYLNAITNRKSILLNLESTREITKRLVSTLLKSTSAKILVYSELTEQINKICANNVHSNNDDDTNKKNLDRFNSNEIRVLGSCYSLTLGLNLNNAKIAVFESYLSSTTAAKQRRGRLNRLDTNDVAQIYIIRLPGTQSEEWFNRIVNTDEIVSTIDSSEILNNTWKI